MTRALERELRACCGSRLELNRPLADLTSFRIGGPADLLATVQGESELAVVMAAARRAGVQVFCLGAGTNLLVSDRGVRGLVVRLDGSLKQIAIAGVRVEAGAGADFGLLVDTVVEEGLGGLEFGEGIPGSVGGGLMMNAGAFGGEMARVVESIRGVSVEGRVLSLKREEVGFGYRRTGLPPGFVISRVDFILSRADPRRLRDSVARLRARRRERQPAGMPSAGSVFKNPEGNFAGRLLEAAGIKGLRMGEAAFSEQHANFIVNLGGARAQEVAQLIELARARVLEKSGVCLEPEVKLVGDW